jgi:hypothetical protein
LTPHCLEAQKAKTRPISCSSSSIVRWLQKHFPFTVPFLNIPSNSSALNFPVRGCQHGKKPLGCVGMYFASPDWPPATSELALVCYFQPESDQVFDELFPAIEKKVKGLKKEEESWTWLYIPFNTSRADIQSKITKSAKIFFDAAIPELENFSRGSSKSLNHSISFFQLTGDPSSRARCACR